MSCQKPLGEWVRLQEGSDWGRVYYALPGKLLANGHASISNGLPLREGSMTIRMPDGTVLHACLQRRVSTDTVSDHGHSYPVEQVRFGFSFQFHGISVWVPITEVELRLADLAH